MTYDRYLQRRLRYGGNEAAVELASQLQQVNMPPYLEVYWSGSFSAAPDYEMAYGDPFEFSAALKSGNTNYSATQQISLEPGTYQISASASVIGADTPLEADPLKIGEISLSWDENAAGFGATVTSSCPAYPFGSAFPGNLPGVAVSLTAVFQDPGDLLGLQIDNPYGGINTGVDCYLNITKTG